ncbi:MAG TPA: sulfatase-like hydrolase/transferase, partial [bacterium]|nr:sulfatase-like hydrolase/transferase [bacterium]
LAVAIASPRTQFGPRSPRFLAAVVFSLLLILPFALLLLVGVNISVLPSDTDPRALAIDAGVLVFALLLSFFLARSLSGRRRFHRLFTVAIVTIVAFAISLATWRGGQGAVGPPVTKAPPAAPDVVLVLIDTLQGNLLSSGGNPHPTSPWLDRLSRQGARFASLSSQSCYTKPAVASLLTSLEPSSHGVGHLRTVLRESLTTLPEAFHAAGYRTAMVCSNTIIGAEFGFAQGAEWFHTLPSELTGKTKLGYALRRLGEERGVAAVASFLQFLRAVERSLGGADPRIVSMPARDVARAYWEWRVQAGDQPCFTYLHFMEPHEPYKPPKALGLRFLKEPGTRLVDHHPPIVGLFLPFSRADSLPPAERAGVVASYEGEIASVDRVLGPLLENILVGDRPVIIAVTADHGEEFYEHGGWGHGQSLYEEQLRIPGILCGAGIPQGEMIASPAQLIDLAPTLLDLAGIAAPAEMRGRSWKTEIASGSAAFAAPASAMPHDVEILSEIVYGDSYWARCLHEGSWKLIVSRWGEKHREQLFDLRNDALELNDRAPSDSAMLDSMRLRLDALVQGAQQGKSEEVRGEFDAATIERLRALGYVR